VKEIAQLLNAMLEAGAIADYALFGALAQVRYTEPVATLDADVLVDVPDPGRLDVLTPLYEFCANRGYTAEGETIRVGEWPLQLIPVFSPLTREAMASADAVDYEGVPLRVVRADYLAVIALEVGRPKDMARILALLESGSVTPAAVAALASRHGLEEAWERFRTRFLND
jgi:hypothetical protein